MSDSLTDKASEAVKSGAEAVGLSGKQEDGSQKTMGEKISDYHNAWGGKPGDSGEREHGQDPSTSVQPEQGSAKAPEFLKGLGGATQSGAAPDGEPTQPVGKEDSQPANE